ncbi:hypothetical protein F4780DRAFT_786508 [Xylariomycetidae sp. FL0641]|nr:hypothetical protein F4780DRAFT_786508 [Xylariomycetidae sp. FL0641]
MDPTDTSSSLRNGPDNHGAVVNVVAWFLMVTSSLVVFTRIVTKWMVSKRFHADDGLIVVAQVIGSPFFPKYWYRYRSTSDSHLTWLPVSLQALSVSQVAATSIAVANGLGRHISELTLDDISAFEKSLYAANVLYVAGDAAAKLSALSFIRILSPIAIHRRLAVILAGVTALWAFTSIVALLFQCVTPRPWDFLSNTCISRPALWDYINAMNILLDTCLILLPSAMIWKLQTRLKRRLGIISCFLLRLLEIAAVGWQIRETRALPDRQDATMSYWHFVVAMTLAHNLGIIASCILYLKPLLVSLEAGMIRSDDIRRRAELLENPTPGHAPKQQQDGVHARSQSSIDAIIPYELQGIGNRAPRASAVVTVERRNSEVDWEVASHASERKLIRQVRTWGITRTPVPSDSGHSSTSKSHDELL